ncbi:hypothetical protein [Nonomuraea bangladeshensis]|uniref:nSTAND1 domain-containing NTPase n=1 Tax=Nonomuraea bangladeshensis TaxID=404385 RepID=UPI003C2E5E66
MANPARINSRTDLHAALHQLFEDSESSFLEVATAADTGQATVHDMVRGNSFPRWTTLRKVLRALGVADADLDAWKQAHARAGRDDECPYRGLEHFGPEHVRYFFGRRELTRLLWDRVSAQIEQDAPLLVTGPSGAGKSSLLQAGLIPAADKTWPNGHAILTPSSDPVQVLADRFCGKDAPRDVRNHLAETPALLRDLLAQARCRLLIVDQFEEVFTSCADADDRRVFIQALHAACTPAQGARATVVVIGMRADFFGHCAVHPELAPSLAHPLVVGPMTTAQLRETIEKPVDLAQLTLEAGLAERILEDLGAASVDDTILPAISSDPGGVLPLLSHTLRETWGHREGRKLTLAGYQATGGVSQSLARSADAALDDVGLANRDRARRLVTRLVHLGEGGEPSLRKVPLAELLGPEDDPGHDLVRQVLDRFVERRLVTVDSDLAGNDVGSTAQFTHEALIRAWKQLSIWIEEDRASLLVREQLDRDARTWVANGRDAAYLYRGLRLANARNAGADHAYLLGNDARDFLEAGIRHDRAWRRRRSVRYIAVTLVFALIASLTTFLANQMRVGAERATESQSRALASLTLELADSNPGLAALAAIAAYKTSPTQEARNALLRRYDQFKNAAWALTGAQGMIRSAAMSADGTVTLVVANLGRATLFIRQGDGKVMRRHLNVDGSATFPLVSRDGRRVAYTLDGQGDMVWHDLHLADRDVVGPAHRLQGAELRTFMLGGQWGELSIAAFSPRAEQIATVDSEGRLRVWDLPGRKLRTLPQLPSRLRQVWFGPDENTLVAELRDDAGPLDDSHHSVVSLDLRTGKVRKLDDRRSNSEQPPPDFAVSNDGRVLIACRTLKTRKIAYRAVLVADGRQLARYTSDSATCSRFAVDATGEHFAVFSGTSAWIMKTRPDAQPQRFVGPAPSDRVLGLLLEDSRDPVMVLQSSSMVAAWRMFPDDMLMIHGLPMLLDHGRMMLARTSTRGVFSRQPDTLRLVETRESEKNGRRSPHPCRRTPGGAPTAGRQHFRNAGGRRGRPQSDPYPQPSATT